jgi:hypothetical protein
MRRERRQGRPPRFRDALPEEMAPHLAAAKAGAGALAILEDPLSPGQWNEVVMRVSRLRLPAAGQKQVSNTDREFFCF